MNNYEATLETVRGLSEGGLKHDPDVKYAKPNTKPIQRVLRRFFKEETTELTVELVNVNDSGMALIKWPSGNITEVSCEDLLARFKETKL